MGLELFCVWVYVLQAKLQFNQTGKCIVHKNEVPRLWWKLQNKRVLVSIGTKQYTQQNVLEKPLPFSKSILDIRSFRLYFSSYQYTEDVEKNYNLCK